MRWPLRLVLVAGVVSWLVGAPVRSEAAPLGELGLSGGWAWPQGSFTEFAEPGPTIHLRATYHVPGAESLIGWADFSYTKFRENRSPVDIRIPGYTGPADRVSSESAWVLHVGPQIGSPTSTGFFRPRAGVGVGFYVFARSDDYHYEDNFGDDATYPGYDGLLLGRFGWRGDVGADFFFRPDWGISADVLYDHIWSANSTSPARYQAVCLGVVIPI